MSQIGNIQNMYGNKLSIAIANASIKQLEQSSNLPANTLIISAVPDEIGNDAYCCLAMTDYAGVLSRISYHIVEGNGLYADSDATVLSLNIDNKTLIDKDNELSVNISELIDNKTIIIKNNKLVVDYTALNKASATKYGLVQYDGLTIKCDNQHKLYIATENLTKASGEIYGIVKLSDQFNYGDTISVNTNKLTKCEKNTLGIAKADNDTLTISEGILHIVTENLSKSTDTTLGIAKPDGKTILSDNGILYVNQNQLPKCSSSTAGYAKLNEDVFALNNGETVVKDLPIFNETNYDKIIKELDNLYEIISKNKLYAPKDSIYSLSFNSSSVANLSKPQENEQVSDMTRQVVYATVNVSSSTDFIIDVVFNNNINPAAEVLAITYDSKITYTGSDCLKHVFPSTEGQTKTIIITIGCYNFYSATAGFSAITTARITATSENSTYAKKYIIYSIMRYNSCAMADINVTELALLTNYYDYVITLQRSYWVKNIINLRKTCQRNLNIANEAKQLLIKQGKI